jgi:hypothetical protein
MRRAETCPGRKSVPHAVSTASQRVSLIPHKCGCDFSQYFTRAQGIPKYKTGLGGVKDRRASFLPTCWNYPKGVTGDAGK